jgi:hypothetical protein
MNIAAKLAFTVALLASIASAEAPPCLLVHPTQGFQTAFGSVKNKYEYLDSFRLPAASQRMIYKKKDLEKLQQGGVHVVVVPRDAVREQIKEARESCDKPQ